MPRLGESAKVTSEQTLQKKRLSALSKANTAKAVKKVEAKYQADLKKIQAQAQAQIETARENIIKAEVPGLVSTEVTKALDLEKTRLKNEAMRFRMAPNFNANVNPDRKQGSDIPFSYLRRMATLYPIARACINRRIRQITQLGWQVTTVDEIKDEKGYEAQIATVNAWLKAPMGHKTRMREMLTIMVDDILTVDATSFEIQRRVGGEFMHLIPVDPTTIVLRLTETGATPEPPEVAYAQFINGIKRAEFSTAEFIYEAMNNRSYSPYGLAPLESLILQTEAALRGMVFNLGYFKENNIPEGFLTLPEDVVANADQVQEWQDWYDAIMAGDQRMIHRLKIIPGGSVYTPAKKPEDMSFERFELWLLQQTCAVFDVPPQDIGITYQVNKATGETQSQLSNERGLFPLANFIKEIFDDIVQVELGFPELQMKPQNLDPVDLKEEAEIAEKEIGMGALSVDEYRIEHGRQPIGLEHYVMTSSGPMLVKDIAAGKVGPTADATRADVIAAQPKEEPVVPDDKPKDKPKEDDEDPEAEKLMLGDLKRWRKCLLNDLEKGGPLRTWFPSKYIPEDIHKSIEEAVVGISSRNQIKLLFDQFLDPEVKAAMRLLDMAHDMKEEENGHAAISTA